MGRPPRRIGLEANAPTGGCTPNLSSLRKATGVRQTIFGANLRKGEARVEMPALIVIMTCDAAAPNEKRLMVYHSGVFDELYTYGAKISGSKSPGRWKRIDRRLSRRGFLEYDETDN